MTLLNDSEISFLCKKHKMISPFEAKQVRQSKSGKKIISYGLSSFGYDIRLRQTIYEPALLTKTWAERKYKKSIVYPFDKDIPVIDPKADGDRQPWVARTIGKTKNDYVYTLPPHGFILGCSVEHFHIPEDVLAVCLGKSTYARCGIIVNVTPLEPGWSGFLTIEISNTTDYPVNIYAKEGIAQLLFYKGERPAVTYADRGGKYNNQEARPVLPRM